jgi:small-conductance mechanosensitive channel
MGTVEHIGVKTTRLRSLNGEQLIFSNTDLTNSRISNYKSMRQRRVLLRSELRMIPNMIN